MTAPIEYAQNRQIALQKRPIAQPGQPAGGDFRAKTGINVSAVVGKTDVLAFTGDTWLATETVTTTFDGIDIVSTLPENTDNTGARDYVLQILQEFAHLRDLYLMTGQGTNELHVQRRQIGMNFTLTAADTSAAGAVANTPGSVTTGMWIPFGCAVQVAAGHDKGAQFPAGAGTFAGIAMRDERNTHTAQSGQIGPGKGFSYMVNGRVWCINESAVTRGQQVYYRHTADAGLLPGVTGFAGAAGTGLATAGRFQVATDAAPLQGFWAEAI